MLPTLQVFFLDGFWLLVSILHIALFFVFVLNIVYLSWASLIAQLVKNLPALQETLI